MNTTIKLFVFFFALLCMICSSVCVSAQTTYPPLPCGVYQRLSSTCEDQSSSIVVGSASSSPTTTDITCRIVGKNLCYCCQNVPVPTKIDPPNQTVLG